MRRQQKLQFTERGVLPIPTDQCAMVQLGSPWAAGGRVLLLFQNSLVPAQQA